MNIGRVIVLFGMLALAACAKPSATTQPAAAQPAPAQHPAAVAHASDSRPPGIPWFEGSVEEAFAAAKAANKPVLLYWGAAWCPPCHLLKTTVFADAAFQAKSRLFVPVYLDGDLEGAQRWGDHFRISGYPTVLALNPDQTEIRRIAGGMDLNRYAVLLDDVLDNRQSVDEALKSITASSGTVDVNACRRVAWNAWGLDDGLAAADGALSKALLTAARRCAKADRALALRLYAFAAASSGADSDADSKTLESLLADTQFAAEQVDALQEIGADYFRKVAKADPVRARHLADLYSEVMHRASGDARYPAAVQLGTIYSELTVQQAVSDDKAKVAALTAAARARVQKEQAALPQDPYVRSGIINGMLNVMDALGDYDAAYQLTRHEVDVSPYGYYFMADLADICESLHRNDEALSWFERSYRESKGPATRFQWGAQYLQALLRLAPDDVPRIQAAGSAVLKELAAPDAVYRRSRKRLAALDVKLRAWRDESPLKRAPVTKQFSEEFAQVCKTNCGAFLAT